MQRSYSVRKRDVTQVANNTLYSHGQEKEGRLGCGRDHLQYTTKPVPVLTPKDMAVVRGVCCADDFAMCWDSAGKLYVWGSGRNGRLGLGCRGGSYKYVVCLPTRL